MLNNDSGARGEQKSRVRLLLRIMLLLAEDYRPLDEMGMKKVLKIVKDHLIKLALKETGGNATAAGKILGINRTTLIEYFRSQGGPDSRFFERRRYRRSEQPAESTEPTGRNKKE
jgi:DNA-binding NtrC family response regulator